MRLCMLFPWWWSTCFLRWQGSFQGSFQGWPSEVRRLWISEYEVGFLQYSLWTNHEWYTNDTCSWKLSLASAMENSWKLWKQGSLSPKALVFFCTSSSELSCRSVSSSSTGTSNTFTLVTPFTEGWPQGLADRIHKKAHLCFTDLLQMTFDWIKGITSTASWAFHLEMTCSDK